MDFSAGRLCRCIGNELRGARKDRDTGRAEIALLEKQITTANQTALGQQVTALQSQVAALQQSALALENTSLKAKIARLSRICSRICSEEDAMSAAQIVNAILFSSWPWMIGIAFWMFHFLIQRLAAHTRLAHRQFAEEAVEKAEQQNPGGSWQAKKAIAMTEINQLCDDYTLPHPKPKAMDVHLESAAYRLKKSSHDMNLTLINSPLLSPVCSQPERYLSLLLLEDLAH